MADIIKCWNVCGATRVSYTIWRRQWQPLQCSCLENPMGRRTWWAKVHTVTKSQEYLGFPGGSDGKESAWMQETGIWSLDWEDPMWNEMATHSSTLPWRIPWTEEPGSLLSMGSPKFDNGWAIALISHANKVMLKILQARLQQYMNCELPEFKLVLEKAEEPEIKSPASTGSSKKQENSRKTSISALLTTPESLTVWITINCRKFWKRWDYQTT